VVAFVGLAQQAPPPPPPNYPQQQQGPPPAQSYPPQQYPPQQQPPPPQGYPQQGPPPGYPQQGYPPQGYPSQQGYPQQQYPPAYAPPRLYPQQLDQLVERIALYPDPLLAQVLTGSTYGNEIPDAATWSNQHSFLHGDALARAISEDNLQFDPPVMALLPFPQVLDMMARDPGWTQALGNAVLAQRPDVMDAVQRMRQEAANYGYLRSNPNYNVVMAGPGDIEIVPVNPAYVFVPFYNPLVVFAAPRPGFFVGGAISFGPGVFVSAFAPFGWAGPGLAWRSHDIIIGHQPWVRTWANRGVYAHPYANPVRRATGPRVERHDVRPPAAHPAEHERDRH
jgi:Protein of unknown function (DUF3300)